VPMKRGYLFFDLMLQPLQPSRRPNVPVISECASQ
jgi:hypothetical protein